MDDVEATWLDRVRDLPPERVFVQHNPPTARYGRAQVKLGYVLREAHYLGVREAEGSQTRLEIATWTRAPSGRGFGYYACFRLYFDKDVLAAAMLFCFYDGTERSPGFKSLEAALQYARARGFEVTP